MKRILEVQKEIGSLAKQSKNPFFKSAYLDLNDLLTHITPILNAKGLVLTQPLENNTVYSIISDAETGQSLINSSLTLPANLTDPQKIGSCITYFRRYTLKSLLAISEVDDDGNLAAKPTKETLSDDKLKGCEDWTAEQKQAVIKKYKLTSEQLEKLK
jgi:hypothetical protein